MKANDIFESSGRPDLTPMIDVVFLMLVFFMVTTELIKQEGDLGIKLPTTAAPKPAQELPSKHMIDIMPDGSIMLNGGPTGDPVVGDLNNLANMLTALKASADRLDRKTLVTIYPDTYSPHFRTIDVLAACSRARIKYVSFASVDSQGQ